MDDNQKQLILDFKTTFGSENGNRVLDNLRTFCRSKVSCFSKDPLEMALLEGQRNVILYIESALDADLNSEKPKFTESEE